MEISKLRIRGPFGLAMAPGFFRKYAYVGALTALERASVLDIAATAGASAGAIVSGFLCGGMLPSEMSQILFNIKREDFWDLGGWGFFMGIIRGNSLDALLEAELGKQGLCNAEDAKIPFAATAFDILHLRTRIIRSGKLSDAIRASCAVPVMFQPVFIEGSPHVDGGIFDGAGILGLQPPGYISKDNTNEKKAPKAKKYKTVVNFMCDKSQVSQSVLPPGFPETTKLITIVLENVPHVNPFTMSEAGPVAYNHAMRGMQTCLDKGAPCEKRSKYHTVFFVDCSK
jgi:NTE family protein